MSAPNVSKEIGRVTKTGKHYVGVKPEDFEALREKRRDPEGPTLGECSDYLGPAIILELKTSPQQGGSLEDAKRLRADLIASYRLPKEEEPKLRIYESVINLQRVE